MAPVYGLGSGGGGQNGRTATAEYTGKGDTSVSIGIYLVLLFMEYLNEALGKSRIGSVKSNMGKAMPPV